MNNKINEKGVEEVRKIIMSAEEKKRIHDQVLSVPVGDTRPVRSMWVAPVFLFTTTMKRFFGKAKGLYKKRV